MHSDDAADALFFASGGVKDVAASFQYARVDADEDYLADERISGNLEGQRSHWFLVAWFAADFVASFWIFAPNFVDVERTWQVICHQIKQFFDNHAAAVAASYQIEVASQHAFAQRALEFVDSNRFLALVEELHHQAVVGFNSVLDQQAARVLGFFEHISRNLANFQLVVSVIIVSISLHIDQIDHAANIFFKANRQVDRECLLAEAVVN